MIDQSVCTRSAVASLLLALGLLVAGPGAAQLDTVTATEDTLNATDGTLNTTEDDTPAVGDSTEGTLDEFEEATEDTEKSLDGDGSSAPADPTHTGSGLLDAAGTLGVTSCQPSQDHAGFVACQVPPSCEDQLHQHPACVPPPQCWEGEPGTYLCATRETLDELPPEAGPQPDSDELPACLPLPDHWGVLACHLAEACGPYLELTPRCTPGPECEPASPGVYLCALVPDPVDPATLPPDWARATVEARAVVDQELDGFQASLDALEQERQATLQAFSQRYEAARDELRDLHEACLRQAYGEDVTAETCRRQAHDALAQARGELVSEYEAWQASLTQRAEQLKLTTCAIIGGHLGHVLQSNGLEGHPVTALIQAEDVALCADVGLGQDALAALAGSR